MNYSKTVFPHEYLLKGVEQLGLIPYLVLHVLFNLTHVYPNYASKSRQSYLNEILIFVMGYSESVFSGKELGIIIGISIIAASILYVGMLHWW